MNFNPKPVSGNSIHSKSNLTCIITLIFFYIVIHEEYKCNLGQLQKNVSGLEGHKIKSPMPALSLHDPNCNIISKITMLTMSCVCLQKLYAHPNCPLSSCTSYYTYTALPHFFHSVMCIYIYIYVSYLCIGRFHYFK